MAPRPREAMSYASVVQGQRTRGDSVKTFAYTQGISFIPTTDTQAWLSRCAVGLVKNPADMGVALYAWSLHGYEDVRVSKLGGDSMLACFPGVDTMQLFLREEPDWVKLWFSSLKPWQNGDQAKNRRCWLSIRGMPLQAWCSEFFQLMGSVFGQLIGVDSETEQRQCLEGARIEILTAQGGTIEKNMEVCVAGERCSVWVVEISRIGCSYQKHNSRAT
ncbi:hypothetical protein Tsubulata_051485 [Turnera subulata]|uniref:DUF4283 domain-containing protein n=1 Tax=Turnera subulata TaxID=218843 RepID=A0A9Q0J841_9ROSI|nr:hypothetical protein Tsubulata_051485 [Turnera subulata]